MLTDFRSDFCATDGPVMPRRLRVASIVADSGKDVFDMAIVWVQARFNADIYGS
jgi:hypothetical protein